MNNNNNNNNKKNTMKNMKMNNNFKTIKKEIKNVLRIEDFSKKYRKRAKKLLALLRKSNKVAYNKQMEFVYKGNVIKHSNVISLIQHALDENNKRKLKGMKRFYTMLYNIGIPNTLIKNKWGLSKVKHSKKNRIVKSS